ncbi:MAG TPA: MBL fold metallo-hydrolase [Chitinophagaceae bacterium]|nr:MBL fold metallo-hydrolase [Chitinophagaceae bacterium]
MIIFLIILLALVLLFILFIRQPKFGKSPSGKRLDRIRQSPHFRRGKFQNLNPTPQFTEGYTMRRVMYDYFFKQKPHRKPSLSIPAVKTTLKDLPAGQDLLVWFGHSSYYLQVNGKKILVDPVFSGNASPLPGTNTAFKGADAYTVSDLPFIDYLLITHDHYDHLDYHTITGLKDKVGKVITGLGTGAHLERWGYAPEIIIEKDWYEKEVLTPDMVLHITPARHFSGRGFTRNNTLWVSFVLQAKDLRLFLGGDSGYDTHFAETGRRFGPFDLAILDNGQYNEAWRLIHAHPEENLQAAKDLQAKRMMPVHSGKFAMANHTWDEPLNMITALNENGQPVPLLTPRIGEIVYLRDEAQHFDSWWKELK